MQSCDKCNDPAVKSCLIGDEGQSESLCYLHAAEGGLLGVSATQVRRGSNESGYPGNALLFVGEAISRHRGVSTVAELCDAIISTASKRFGPSAPDILERWRIRHRSDIGAIFQALTEAGLAEPCATIAVEDFATPFGIRDLIRAFRRGE